MDENKNVETEVAKTSGKKVRIKKTKDEILELIVVICLGITALFTAWASWIGSLHGGNQATNYTTSNNIAADGNSRWNEASQTLMQDMATWNTINDYMIEIAYASQNGDEQTVEKYTWKVDEVVKNNCTEEFQEVILWALDQEFGTSPFDYEGYVDSYYDDAAEYLAESEEILAQGKEDNANGDAFGLVTVIYSVVLFLLGIVSTFKSYKNKIAVTGISIVAFLLATIYMLTLPMPTGFDLFSFLK